MIGPHYVDIVRYIDDGVERRLGPFQTVREADRVADGVDINLNHAEFYTLVRQDAALEQSVPPSD